MIIVRLLSPEPVGWLAPPTLLGSGSRHCHGINCSHCLLAGFSVSFVGSAWRLREGASHPADSPTRHFLVFWGPLLLCPILCPVSLCIGLLSLKTSATTC